MVEIGEVKVANLVYKVFIIVTKDNPNFFYENGTIRMYGETTYQEQTICINGYQSLSRMKACIIHEITHAYLDTIYRGTLVVNNDRLEEEEIAHMFGIYGEEIVSKAIEIYNDIVLRIDLKKLVN